MVKFFKKLFLIKKITFSRLKKKEVILYDKFSLELLKKIIPEKNINILYSNFEQLNLRIIIKLFISFKLNNLNYFAEIIKETQPKIVITFIDNDERFWLLKNIVQDSKIKFVIIQNGLRNDIFSRLNSVNKKYSLDDMFLFNRNTAKYYSKNISGNTHALGSFKNNFYQLKFDEKKKDKRSILFLSSIDSHKNIYETMINLGGNNKISFNKYYEADYYFLKFLKNYCEKKKLRLDILGRNYENRLKEKKIYENLLGNSNFKYIDKKSEYSEFEEISKYDLLVTLDSTLGFEALAQEIKTCFFSIRQNFIIKGGNQYNFRWLFNSAETGFFWTNEKNESKFEQILDQVSLITYDEWSKKIKDISKEFMIYSAQNKIFSDYLIENDISVKSEFYN